MTFCGSPIWVGCFVSAKGSYGAVVPSSFSRPSRTNSFNWLNFCDCSVLRPVFRLEPLPPPITLACVNKEPVRPHVLYEVPFQPSFLRLTALAVPLCGPPNTAKTDYLCLVILGTVFAVSCLMVLCIPSYFFPALPARRGSL